MPMHYSVFLESLWTASLIPFGNEPAFFAMKSFGGYDMRGPFILAVIGATLGQLFNWLLGKLLLLYGHKANLSHNIPRYLQVAHYFNRYGIWLLIFSWGPMCKLLPLFAGFTGAPWKRVFLLIFIGQVINYGRYFI